MKKSFNLIFEKLNILDNQYVSDISKIKEFCPSMKNKKILEIGCGQGKLVKNFHMKNINISAIELDKNYYNTYENMIKLLRDKNDYKGMISTLKIMQSLNPQNSFLVIREAQVFELLGDTITSKKLYSDGIEKFKEVVNDDSGFDLRQEYFMSLFF